MALYFFNNSPFNIATRLVSLDLYTGDGVTTEFELLNKSGANVGSTAQFDGTQYYKYLGGMTVSGDTVTLSSAPGANTQGVIPGLSSLVLNAFDTDDVSGVVNPRIDTQSFFIADVEEIGTYQYEAVPGDPGIKIILVNNITAVGPTLSWVQLACADPVTGVALTYAATGEALYTPNLTFFSELSSACNSLDTILQVVSASGFVNGDYLIINIGNATQEVVHLAGISSNTLTISGTNFAHSIGETVFACGRKFWAKLTVPEDATEGQAQNYYNFGLQRRAQKLQRL